MAVRGVYTEEEKKILADFNARAEKMFGWGKLPSRVDLVYHFEENLWNRISEPQLRVQEIRPAQQDAVPREWRGEAGPGGSGD